MKLKHKLINGNCLDILEQSEETYDCLFGDPPDGIGLGYDSYNDKTSELEYRKLLWQWVGTFVTKAPIVWLSFNAKWTFALGGIFDTLVTNNSDWEAKPCVQVFTFGQHNSNDMGNNHRPLWRLKRKDAKLYPDQIKVPSWRERNGDKRAKPGGRVPGDVFDMQYPRGIESFIKDMKASYATEEPNAVFPEALIESCYATMYPGDVLDFPRVTGNSKQRCDWHPTQLHEELVARAVKLSTAEGGSVIDPFGGTGTTLRVCKSIQRNCTLLELDAGYCAKIKEAHPEVSFKKF